MNLSSDLISQFVKVTKDETPAATETTVYGTAVEYNDSIYVKLDGSDQFTPVTTTTDIEPGERVAVMIKNHTATVTGNISSPAARTDTVKGISTEVGALGGQITEFEGILAKKVSTDELAAELAAIDTLYAKEATVTELQSQFAQIEEVVAGKVDTEDLEAERAEIDEVLANKLDADVAEITYATIKGLEATDASVNNLEATYADFAVTTTEQFEAVNADIKDLVAKDASIDVLLVEKATIVDLEAAEARIGAIEAGYLTASSAEITNLEADVGEINTLMFGSATGDTLQTTFANAVIALLGDAQIKAAMIESITADQIASGDILTNNVRVVSEDAKLVISDETIQISDENRVRVQIGKDASGDYSINIWDADGDLMFSEGGITDSAIKEAIIRNDMVSDMANISASKLNISSLFSVINEDKSNTLNASKILIDADGQNLEVSFKQMTTSMNELEENVESQGTDISVIQGQISSKIWQQDIAGLEIGGTNLIRNSTDLIYDKYSFAYTALDPVKLDAPTIYLELPKLDKPAIKLVAVENSDTSAVLGEAILGSMVLGSE